MVVFPIGAYRRELAADHLADEHIAHSNGRLPRKRILDWSVHDGGVTEDGDTTSAHQPEKCANGAREDGNWDTDACDTSVQLRRSSTESANLQIATSQSANDPHADCHKDYIKQKPGVGEKGIDRQHDKDDGIVAGEVSQVVVDSCLDISKVSWLRQSLEVEELSDGFEVGESL